MKRSSPIAILRDRVHQGSSISKRIYPPLRLLAVTLLAVFAGEFLVMSILLQLTRPTSLLTGLMDALVLVILIFPVLYFSFLKPFLLEIDNHRRTKAALQVNVTERTQAEYALQKVNEELELRVRERTQELAQANQSLQVEVTERRRAEEDARRALAIARERQAEISALLQASCAVLEQPSFRAAARMILEICEDLVGAKGGYISLVDEVRSDVEILVQDLAELPDRPSHPAPNHATGLWELARYNRITVYKNCFPKSKWAHALPEGHFLPENVLVSPVVVDQAVIGFLNLFNKSAGFSKSDANLATAFTELIAIALVKNQAEEGLRKARDELEIRVQERTQDLARVNEELRIEIAERKKAEDALRESEEKFRGIALQNEKLYRAELQARQMAETLCSTSLALTQSLKLDTVMNALLDNIGRLVNYDSASVILLEEDSRLVTRAAHGYERWKDPDRVIAAIIDSLTRLIACDRSPVRKNILIPDLWEDPVWKTHLGSDLLRNWLCVPLGVRDKMIGFCELSKDEPGYFTQEHVQLVEALAGQAAVAIQNAWLFEQLQTGRERLQSLSRRLVEVQETERRYIASELHDEAAQTLTSLMVGLRLMERNAEQPASVIAGIAELKRTAQEVLENLHGLAMDLRPASLDHLGLVPALGQHLESTSDKHGLVIQYEVLGLEQRLPSEMETALYRIVQEALINVIRHANASRVDVLLEQHDDRLTLTVEDNGIGFEPSTVAQTGRLGLFGMRERAEMLGGDLIVESQPGRGTTISVEVPNALKISHRR